MKKHVYEKPQKDFLLISILALLVVAFFVLGTVLSHGVRENRSADLPDSYDNLIGKLVINEIMTNNDGSYANEKGAACDFLEIYNGTAKTVNLDGYGLSDRKDRIKWAFSNTVLGPGEYIVVALTGKLEDGFNADFKLSSKGGENVILTNPRGKVIDAVETVALSKGQVMARDGSGQWVIYGYATPGQDNSREGLEKYIASLQAEGRKWSSMNCCPAITATSSMKTAGGKATLN